jgi:hypothetical protein
MEEEPEDMSIGIVRSVSSVFSGFLVRQERGILPKELVG